MVAFDHSFLMEPGLHSKSLWLHFQQCLQLWLVLWSCSINTLWSNLHSASTTLLCLLELPAESNCSFYTVYTGQDSTKCITGQIQSVAYLCKTSLKYSQLFHVLSADAFKLQLAIYEMYANLWERLLTQIYRFTFSKCLSTTLRNKLFQISDKLLKLFN